MALTPYTVTALAQNDSQGTNGDNIVVGALVFAIAINGGATATLYDNAAGDNPSTTKQTGGNGQVTFYVEEGEYILSVNGVTSLVSLVSSDNVARLSDLKGKNLITDGRFDFWYEGTSQTSSGYGSDTMWLNLNAGSTKTHSQGGLGSSELPRSDNPTATFSSRTVVSSVAGASNFVNKQQRIENVRTLAGKAATLSFYAKADSPKEMAVSLDQNFGSGGSPTATGIGAQKVSLTTSWQRYEVIVDIPNLSGKTIGVGGHLRAYFWFDAGSDFDARTDSLGQQSGTFDIACVQLEDGSQATKFEEELPNIALERVSHYYSTSYPSNTTVGSAATEGLAPLRVADSSVLTRLELDLTFGSEMAGAPSITLYSQGGNVGQVSLYNNSASTLAVSGVSASSKRISPLVSVSSPALDNTLYYCNYVADARL